MGATIFWQAVTPKSLGVSTPQSFMNTMKNGFGQFPVTLTVDAIPILKGMASASSDPEPYNKLIELLDKHNGINIWAEW